MVSHFLTFTLCNFYFVIKIVFECKFIVTLFLPNLSECMFLSVLELIPNQAG